MPNDRTWIIGASAECDIRLDFPTVSSRHCRLTKNEAGFLLEDLQSTNGTFVNGKRIGSPTNVSRADAITLGQVEPMPWPDAVETTEARQINIGRCPDNDVVLAQPVVSGHHARIVFSDGQPWIEDLGSRNGTAIGSPENKISRARLSADDIVYFGSFQIQASQLLTRKTGTEDRPAATLAIEEKTIILGRDEKCDLFLNDPRVSRHHARLVRTGDIIIIEDLGSTNGTFVNGMRIEGASRLRSGDIVSIGSHYFKLTPEGNLEQRDYRGNMAIEARGIIIEVPGKRLLEDISLTVYPSEFVGLMGPSGSGKTTLMNALNGYTPPNHGHVIFNGRDLYANYAEFQGAIGYVPQDDIMHRELTVGQALYYTARLRLPKDFSDAEIQKRIGEVIAQLGLEGTENVIIGSPERKGISGGQRKRVNLAMELLTDPSVLFLDEPTSGLSSEDALMVIKLLRKLADEGKTIILTIHQPSLEAYRQLDNLILVSKDPGAPQPGRLVYYGPAYPQAVDFFNPQGIPDLRPGAEPSPDEILRGLARDRTSSWIERYAASPYKNLFVNKRAGKRIAAPNRPTTTRTHRSPGFTQWLTLVRRSLKIKVGDKTNTAILMAQAPIIAILVTLVFGKQTSADATWENWASVANAASITVFLLALAALWFGCSNSAREIVGEWAIYHRERMVSLKIPSYVCAKFAVLGGLCIFQCAVLLGIVYYGGGLKGPWLSMFFMLLLTSVVGLSIGLTLSALARTSEVAIALLPLILLPMVILAGVLQPLHKMNAIGWTIAEAMPSRWAFESLLLLESDHRPLWTPPALPAAAAPPADKETPIAEKPKSRDMAENFFPQDTERMGVYAGGMVLIATLALLVSAIHFILKMRDVH